MTVQDPILPPARALAATAARPLERAFAMPKAAYTSPDFLALELERIFAREWLCAGRADALKAPGDYLTLEIAGEPIVVLRDREGVLRAMSNVCRHRMSTLLEGRGNVRSIVCPYHAWTYGLDGSLRGAPAMKANAAFCKEEVRLPQIRCREWLGWILVSLDPDAPEPAERLAGVAALVGHLGMEHYTETFREEHVWDTNWKVLAENFMESYHLPVCHAGTIGHSVDLMKMTCPEGTDAFNYHWIVKNDAVKLALAHPANTRLAGDERRITWLLSIYPALFITLSPGYFWYLSLHPEGPGKVRILYGGGLAPEFMADPEAEAHFAALKALLDEVNVEDRGCTERVYRGLSSRLGAPGPLSHLERPNHEFAHYLATRLGG